MTESDSHLVEDPYPAELKKAELAAIAERRQINDLSSDAPLVGFALSGGGIRSATFCLGLFQALAGLRLVRRIDLLSTVSGGGYFGSFLGASFMRKDATPQTVEDELADFAWATGGTAASLRGKTGKRHRFPILSVARVF